MFGSFSLKKKRKTPRLGAGDHDTLQQNVEHLEVTEVMEVMIPRVLPTKKKTNQLDSPVGVVVTTDHLVEKTTCGVGDFSSQKNRFLTDSMNHSWL